MVGGVFLGGGGRFTIVKTMCPSKYKNTFSLSNLSKFYSTKLLEN